MSRICRFWPNNNLLVLYSGGKIHYGDLASVSAALLAVLGGSLEAEAVPAAVYLEGSRTARINAATTLSAGLLGRSRAQILT
jgi:hypothetical protein